jgi:hypothetical protein
MQWISLGLTITSASILFAAYGIGYGTGYSAGYGADEFEQNRAIDNKALTSKLIAERSTTSIKDCNLTPILTELLSPASFEATRNTIEFDSIKTFIDSFDQSDASESNSAQLVSRPAIRLDINTPLIPVVTTADALELKDSSPNQPHEFTTMIYADIEQISSEASDNAALEIATSQICQLIPSQKFE